MVCHSPEEVFGHIAECVSLSRKNKHLETFVGFDEGINNPYCVAWVYIVVNLAMYGMYTAAFINCMNIGRTTVFYFREEKAWAKHRAWLALFLAVAVIAPCLTWAGPISLLPTVGSILCCVGFYLRNTLAVKWVLLPGNLVWMTYSILSRNPSAALGNIIVVVSLTVGIVRELRKKQYQSKSESF